MGISVLDGQKFSTQLKYLKQSMLSKLNYQIHQTNLKSHHSLLNQWLPKFLRFTQLSKAIREVGGLFILDGIAAGSIWVDMEKWDVDAYISAP